MSTRPTAKRGTNGPAAAMLVAVVLMTMAVPVKSQARVGNNTLMRYYCSLYQGTNSEFFLRNLNTTISGLRRQISVAGVRYATARTLINGESVWGMALCRGYVSTTTCVACFDTAVDQLRVCGLANGGHAFYNDCDLRYENNNFYDEANLRAGVIICGNISSSQPTEFGRATQGLLSDLGRATPRTSNLFAASTRPVSGSNATVYAIAQCNLNLSQSVCVECLRTRDESLEDCLPNTSGRAIDNGCFMRYSVTPFFGRNQTTDIAPFLWDEDSSNTKSIIGGVVGGVSFLLIILVLFLWRRRSRNISRGQKGKSTGTTDMLQGPMTYSYEDLKMATNDFSDEHKLGGGVFGEVYKGTLKDGDTVAIKKTVMASTRGKTDFDDELKIISNVHHRYLIRLLGYCNKGPLLFLVLEYMKNGSLDRFLYGDKRGTLNWKQRFDIIFGTARGLAYLHEQYHVTIIHRDIKTSNILLDEEFQPKITDFGLIRLLPEDMTHLSTKYPKTMYNDYVAPEYAIHGQLSEKSDTYSFGVVALEIISGKRYNGAIENDTVTQNLLDHAWNLYESGMHLNLIDDTIDHSEYEAEDAKKIIEIVLLCTQSPVSARPAMSEVVTLLSDKSLNEKPPTRPMLPEDDHVKIQVDTSTSNYTTASNATSSTIGFSGR